MEYVLKCCLAYLSRYWPPKFWIKLLSIFESKQTFVNTLPFLFAVWQNIVLFIKAIGECWMLEICSQTFILSGLNSELTCLFLCKMYITYSWPRCNLKDCHVFSLVHAVKTIKVNQVSKNLHKTAYYSLVLIMIFHCFNSDITMVRISWTVSFPSTKLFSHTKLIYMEDSKTYH